MKLQRSAKPEPPPPQPSTFDMELPPVKWGMVRRRRDGFSTAPQLSALLILVWSGVFATLVLVPGHPRRSRHDTVTTQGLPCGVAGSDRRSTWAALLP